MTKLPNSQTGSKDEPAFCPHCNSPIDRTYGREVNYCGMCAGAISEKAGVEMLTKALFAARDYPDLILIINDTLRDTFNKFAEKSGWNKLRDPREILPALAKRYNLDISLPKQAVNENSAASLNAGSSYLAQIAKELHEINMKLGGTITDSEPAKEPEREKPVTKKRGRPKKSTV